MAFASSNPIKDNESATLTPRSAALQPLIDELKSDFLTMAFNGDVAGMRLAIANGFDLKGSISKKFNPLIDAVNGGNPAAVRYLAKISPLNEVDERGYSALMYAILADRVDIVTTLLEAKVDIETLNKVNFSFLMLALRLGCLNIAISLLIHGARTDVNDAVDDNPLTNLLANKVFVDPELALRVVRVLVNKGVLLYEKNKAGLCAYKLAHDNNHQQIIDFFNTKYTYEQLLHRAAINDDMSLCELVLSLGADINAINPSIDNDTTLMIAIRFKNFPMAERLVKLGADVNRPNKHELTPLFGAAASLNLPLCQLLVVKGANVNAIDLAGNTPLLVAVGTANLSLDEDYRLAVVKYLVAEGADYFHLSNKKGKKEGIGVAAYFNRFPKIKEYFNELLLERNLTQFFEAVRVSNKAVLDIFALAGIVDVQDVDGNTPLMLAAAQGHVDDINFLLRYGANARLCNPAGQNVLHFIINNAQPISNKLTLIAFFLEYRYVDIDESVINLARTKAYQEIVSYLEKLKVNIATAAGYVHPRQPASRSNGGAGLSSGSAVEVILCRKQKADAQAALNQELLAAILANDEAKITSLLNSGAEPNTKTKEGELAFHLLIKAEKLELVNEILRRQPAILKEANVSGQLALHIAVLSNHVALLSSLLNRKVVQGQIDAQDNLGNTPLHYAYEKNNLEVIGLLKPFAKKIVKNKEGKTPLDLRVLAKTESVALTEKLPSSESIGSTTLSTKEEASLLKEFRKIIHTESVSKAQHLLGVKLNLATAEPKILIEYLTQLLDEINLLPKDRKEKKELLRNFIVLQNQRQAIYNQLFADIKKLNAIPQLLANILTALDNSMINNLDIVIEQGRRLIHYAVVAKSLALVAALIGKGAKLNEANDKGNTPLHLACALNLYEVAKILMNNGVRLDLINLEGKKPHDLLSETSALNALFFTEKLATEPAAEPMACMSNASQAEDISDASDQATSSDNETAATLEECNLSTDAAPEEIESIPDICIQGLSDGDTRIIDVCRVFDRYFSGMQIPFYENFAFMHYDAFATGDLMPLESLVKDDPLMTNRYGY